MCQKGYLRSLLYLRILKTFQHCSDSLYELQLKTDFQQSCPAVSVSSLVLFEITSSLGNRHAVARTVCLCGAKPVAQNIWIYETIFIFYSVFKNNDSIQWDVKTKGHINFDTLKCICKVLQTYLESSNRGISLAIVCGVSPNPQGEVTHPSTCQTEWRTWRLLCVKSRPTTVETCNVSWLRRYFEWNWFKTYFVSTRKKKFEHKISKITPIELVIIFFKKRCRYLLNPLTTLL